MFKIFIKNLLIILIVFGFLCYFVSVLIFKIVIDVGYYFVNMILLLVLFCMGGLLNFNLLKDDCYFVWFVTGYKLIFLFLLITGGVWLFGF